MYYFYYFCQTKNGGIMKIKQIMSHKLIMCQKNDSIKTASLLMLKHQIGFLPVFDNDKLVGVITDRDIVIRGCTTLNTNQEIKNIISRQVFTVSIDDSLNDCLNLMCKQKIKRVIVIDTEKPVGVISVSDLLPYEEIQNKLLKTLKSIRSITSNEDDTIPKIDDFNL